MPVSMHQVAAPSFVQGLKGLSGILAKAAAHAAARKIDPAALLQARLFPDMFPLVRQVQIASDFAKGTMARLAGDEPPRIEDKETGFDELQARIAWTLDYVRSFAAERIDGSEEREVSMSIRGQATVFDGRDYLVGIALPNFWFHVTTAYDILRHNGVELGKADFMARG